MALKEIRDIVLKCKRCKLHETKKNYVFGDGDENTDILFISEAPGALEDKSGRMFVGRSGGVFDELLASINLSRGDIFVTNILKCRPPLNRNPKTNEIEACIPFLNMQINNIKPKIICTMGNYATQFIMKKYGLNTKIEGISKIHGKVFSVSGLFGSIKIVPLYHPAVGTYNPETKKVLIKDFKIIDTLKTKED